MFGEPGRVMGGPAPEPINRRRPRCGVAEFEFTLAPLRRFAPLTDPGLVRPRVGTAGSFARHFRKTQTQPDAEALRLNRGEARAGGGGKLARHEPARSAGRETGRRRRFPGYYEYTPARIGLLATIPAAAPRENAPREGLGALVGSGQNPARVARAPPGRCTSVQFVLNFRL